MLALIRMELLCKFLRPRRYLHMTFIPLFSTMCTLKNDTLYLCKVIFYILYRNQKFSKNKNPGIVIKQKKNIPRQPQLPRKWISAAYSWGVLQQKLPKCACIIFARSAVCSINSFSRPFSVTPSKNIAYQSVNTFLTNFVVIQIQSKYRFWIYE